MRWAVSTVFCTAGLLAFPAFYIGGQIDGVRAGSFFAIAVLAVTAAIGRAAYHGSLPRPLDRSGALALMSVFAGICMLSVGWSLLPGVSYFDAVRTIAYTAIFGGGVLAARLFGDRAREVALGAGLAALAICLYALASRIRPGWFPATDDFARIRMPFEYWNAVGSVAAFGLLVTLWAGTVREAGRRIVVAAYPAAGVFALVLLLSLSRGALLAAIVAIACWLLLAPRRLRSVALLAAAAAASASVVVWVSGVDALSQDHASLAARTDAGGSFAIVIAAMLLALGAIGWALESKRQATPLAPARRRAIGRVLLVALAISPFVLTFVTVVKSDEGFGAITNRVGDLFSGSTTAPANSTARLTETSSLRARYWGDAYKVFKDHTFHGTGGDTYSVARLAYRTDTLRVKHAHGFVPQAMSDLGMLGLVTALALALCWLVAAGRAVGASRRSPVHWLEDAGDTRLAGFAIALVAFTFGVHSAIDWTWFVPGVAVFGLACAGWTAGAGIEAVNRDGNSNDGAIGASTAGTGRRALRAGAFALVGLLIAAAVYQPVRAAGKVADGFRAVASDPGRAFTLAETAHEVDPTSADPFFLKSVAQSNLHKPKAAEHTLVQLTGQQPGNPYAWLRLAEFRLTSMRDPAGAIEALRPLFSLSPNNELGAMLLQRAKELRYNQLVEAAAKREAERIERRLAKIKRSRANAQPSQ